MNLREIKGGEDADLIGSVTAYKLDKLENSSMR